MNHMKKTDRAFLENSVLGRPLTKWEYEAMNAHANRLGRKLKLGECIEVLQHKRILSQGQRDRMRRHAKWLVESCEIECMDRLREGWLSSEQEVSRHGII